MTSPAIHTLDREHLPDVTSVLCDAFRDYPVMRYVLGAGPHSYEHRLATLMWFFVMARLLRNEPIFGARSGSEIGGVALVSHPEAISPPELALLREEVWAELGPEARARYESFGNACAPFFAGRPRLHLNMIGVRPALRGQGLSRQLLDRVHLLAQELPDAPAVSLTTETAANLSLYAHFGYVVVGHAVVAAELQTWGLLRQRQTPTLPTGQSTDAVPVPP